MLYDPWLEGSCIPADTTNRLLEDRLRNGLSHRMSQGAGIVLNLPIITPYYVVGTKRGGGRHKSYPIYMEPTATSSEGPGVQQIVKHVIR